MKAPLLYEQLMALPEFVAAVREGKGQPALEKQFPEWGERTIVTAMKRLRAEHGIATPRRGRQPKPGAPAPGMDSPSPAARLTETREQTADSLTLTLPRTRLHTLDQLLAHYEIDLGEWEVERFTANTWETAAKNNEGQIITEPLYQVKAVLKRRRLVGAVRDAVAEILADLKAQAPAYAPIPYPKREGGHLAELAIFDAHFGKLCWGPETGGANYDLAEAERLYREAVEDLLTRCHTLGTIERFLLPIGQDLLHVDGPGNMTAKGTPQDVDGRYHRTIVRVCSLLRRICERLSAVAPVDVVIVPGNHDAQAAFHVGLALEAMFEGNPNVTVDNEPKKRKYYRWNSVLLCLTHGNEEKPSSRLSEITASEARRQWGEVRYCEAHIGHWHKLALEERHGFRVRWLPSLCPPDSWHATAGLTGNQQSAVALLWTRENGLAAELHHNVRAVN